MPRKKKPAPRFTLEIQTPANGKLGKTTVTARDAEGKVRFTDAANLTAAAEREKLVRRLAQRLGADAETVRTDLERVWNETVENHQRLLAQAAAGSSESVAQVSFELLDCPPDALRRPLALVGGRGYAACWCLGRAVTHGDPPAMEHKECLIIVRDDGTAFSDDWPGARPLGELELQITLPHPVLPDRGWSGAGMKRYLAGKRPDAAEVFGLLVEVADCFIDFSRSLGIQAVMCEMIACYILATWLLDASHVVGYLWPNGETGAGKTTALQVVTETAYLGTLILAGSSLPTLRDLADYGATLAFDDAEAVMDAKRTDPDKRTLLLAGNRRGNVIAVKENVGDRWVTRHVSTFCPRLFSAIRMPDRVLGSRTIVVPMIRSGDEQKAKRSPMDPANWPCERRRLIDDLWALGLANLRQLPGYDREAADRSALSGRPLEP